MTPINTLHDLIEFSKRIDRQKEVLQLSAIFSAIEKKDISEIYNHLQTIANNRIAAINDYQTAINL
jgi:folylpolyglutamate synthase/dihydropteroate synthase